MGCIASYSFQTLFTYHNDCKTYTKMVTIWSFEPDSQILILHNIYMNNNYYSLKYWYGKLKLVSSLALILFWDKTQDLNYYVAKKPSNRVTSIITSGSPITACRSCLARVGTGDKSKSSIGEEVISLISLLIDCFTELRTLLQPFRSISPISQFAVNRWRLTTSRKTQMDYSKKTRLNNFVNALKTFCYKFHNPSRSANIRMVMGNAPNRLIKLLFCQICKLFTYFIDIYDALIFRFSSHIQIVINETLT